MYAIVPTATVAAAIAAAAVLPAQTFARHLRKSRALPRTPRWPVAAALVLALAITAAVRPYALDRYRVWYVDWRSDKLMARFEGQWPLLRVIREREPDLYAQIRVNALAGLKRNATSEELTAAVRAPVDEYIAGAINLIPDKELLDLTALTTEMVAFLATTKPELCVHMIITGLPGDAMQYVPAEMVTRERQLSEAVILAEKAPGRATVPLEEATPALIEIMQTRSAQTGIPLSEFAGITDGTLPPAKACTAAVEFMRGILEQPPERAAALLRTINSTELQ